MAEVFERDLGTGGDATELNFQRNGKSAPHIVGTDVYLIDLTDIGASPLDELSAWRSTDPQTTAFTEQDNANRPTSVVYERCTSIINPSAAEIFVMGCNASNNNQDPLLSIFNTSSNTWTTIEENADNNALDGGNINITTWDCAFRGAGDPFVAFWSEAVTDMGSQFDHPFFAHRTAGGSWTSGVRIDALADNNDTQWATPVLDPTTDRLHVFYADWSPGTIFLMHRSISSADALGTEQQVDQVDNFTSHAYHQGIAYDVSGTGQIRFAYHNLNTAEVDILKATSAQNPTWTIETVVSLSSNAQYCNVTHDPDNDDIYVIYQEAGQPNNRYEYTRQTHGTTSWDTVATFHENAAGGHSESNFFPITTVATVSSRADTIAWVHGSTTDNSYYGEFSIAAAFDGSESPRGSYPDMARREVRPNLSGMTPSCTQGDEEVQGKAA